ncbi:flagellar protein FlaG [Leadbettera azotonutricia]|uniref:flagellar protein FlaG n=1 Tax=Leadbettera azotonutricia TaxID=150829 RepID=UPI0005C64F9B|nr:flagellar protein FlaG [Leadbettera azotonutricia]
MQIVAASIGNVSSVAQELPQERAVRQARVDAEQRAAAIAQFESTLPGNDKGGETRRIDIKAATQDLEHISLAFNKKLKFVVDHESQEVIVKVIDSQTDKVIKVLPPEELQRLHDRIKETIGFLFDERV